MVAVREVKESPLLGQRVRLRLEFEHGTVEAPPGTIRRVYDAPTYQRGTDQFALIAYDPPALVRRPLKRGLLGPRFEEERLDHLIFRVLGGSLEVVQRDREGNLVKPRFRSSLEQLLLGVEPRLREVKGYAGLPRRREVVEGQEFDDDRDITPYAGAIALRPGGPP